MAIALADKLDLPAGATDTRPGQALRRHAADAPAGHGGGWRGKRAAIARSMATVEEDGRLPIGGCQLQPPGRGYVGRLHFCDHAGERPVAQCILGDRKDIHILPPLRVEQFIRSKTNLFQPGPIEIEGRHRPADGLASICREPRGYAGEKERGSGIVVETG